MKIKKITAGILTLSVLMVGCGAAKEATPKEKTVKQQEEQMEKKPEMKESSTHSIIKTGVLVGTGKEKSEGNVEIKDGKVMLTNFKTAKGPDLHIYLTKGKDVKTGKKLGAIDVDKSEQTFDLGNANLVDYDSVIIYCDKAHVTFGAADLK